MKFMVKMPIVHCPTISWYRGIELFSGRKEKPNQYKHTWNLTVDGVFWPILYWKSLSLIGWPQFFYRWPRVVSCTAHLENVNNNHFFVALLPCCFVKGNLRVSNLAGIDQPILTKSWGQNWIWPTNKQATHPTLSHNHLYHFRQEPHVTSLIHGEWGKAVKERKSRRDALGHSNFGIWAISLVYCWPLFCWPHFFT